MYWPGLSVNSFKIFDPKTPCFLSSSIRSLLEARKAISIPEKKAQSIIARSMIRIPFISQIYPFFLWLCLNHAKKKEITAITAKMRILLPPPVTASLIPAAVHKTPVVIQIISSTRIELFLIFKIYCCSNLFDSSFCKFCI